VTRELPRVEVQPIVRNFNLVSVNDLLLENTVSVSKTVAPRWEVERGQTVEEASCKSAKTSIAQGSVVLLGDNILNPEAKIGKTS
jgi:hypothetical protein